MEWVARQPPNGGFLARGRNSASPAGLFLANVAVLAFSEISGDQFLTGAGASRSCSAS